MNCPKTSKENGQTLVVVLVLLVIAAIVSTAVAYRAIQDIQTTTEERNSAKAAAQVDSFIEIAMDSDVWDDLWSDDVQGCADYGSGEVCPVSVNFWNDYMDLSEMECDDWEVKVRRSDRVESFFVGKDEVVEFDLREVTGTNRASDTALGFSWQGDATYVLLRFFEDGDIAEEIALTYGDPHEWTVPANTEVVDVGGLGDVYSTTLGVSGNADVVRIKPLYGDASITLTGLATDYFQVGAIKSYCYIGDVYRESVSQVVLREYVPAVFDYALFDGTSTIDKGPGI